MLVGRRAERLAEGSPRVEMLEERLSATVFSSAAAAVPRLNERFEGLVERE